MIAKYRIRYTWGGKDYVVDAPSTSPIAALNGFHKLMQLVTERHGVDVIRPMLKPADYKITSLHVIFDANDHSLSRLPIKMVEQKYDLPETPNPDLKTEEALPDIQTEEMPFMKEVAYEQAPRT